MPIPVTTAPKQGDTLAISLMKINMIVGGKPSPGDNANRSALKINSVYAAGGGPKPTQGDTLVGSLRKINTLLAAQPATKTESFNVLPALANNSGGDYPNDVALSASFVPSVNGQVTALKFYKPSTTLGDPITDTNTTHSVSLWTASGTRLAQATSSAEPVGGWITIPITPVALTAGDSYLASFWQAAPSGWIWIASPDFGTLSQSPFLTLSPGYYLIAGGDVFPNVQAPDYWYADVNFEH
jgi:hypothetical protein